MMADNWGFVAAAYGLTAAVLAIYWRHLVRKEHELRRIASSARNVTGIATASTERTRETRLP